MKFELVFNATTDNAAIFQIDGEVYPYNVMSLDHWKALGKPKKPITVEASA